MIKELFQAPEGFVYINYEQHLFGEIIYSTDEVEYDINDFVLVSVSELDDVIEQWRLEHGNTK